LIQLAAKSKFIGGLKSETWGLVFRPGKAPSRLPWDCEAIRLAFFIALLFSSASVPAVAQSAQDAQFFDSDGVQIRYVDKGEGEPVLLIHGFTSRLEFWDTTGVVDALTSNGFRVLAYDARGHGESDKPHAPQLYGEEDVEDALRLLDHLSIERAHVVGYSRGSMIASRLVAQHTDRVRSVVFGGWAVSNPVSMLTLPDCQAVADSLSQGEYPLPLVRAVMPEGVPLPSPDEQALWMKQLSAANDMTALAAAFRSGCEIHEMTSPELLSTGVPALAIVGANDGMAPSVRAMGREMAGAMQVVVIPDAGHYTAPGHPDFLISLVGFLEETG
jgi:pimeloyl-ACP methyl ester carboxylesterase